MKEDNKNPLFVGAMRGISIEHTGYFKPALTKHKPKHFYELKNIPPRNPILIAVDWQSFNYIKQHHGLCLLCDQENLKYDLDFCYQSEVWVLYSRRQKFKAGIFLAHELQWNGASKVVVIAVGDNYGKY